MHLPGWLRKGVRRGTTLLVLFLTTLPAFSDVNVKFSRWEAGQWESVREPGEAHPGKWAQEADCLHAGEKETGVLNFLHRSIEAADVTVESRMAFIGGGAPSLLLRAQQRDGIVGDTYSIVLHKGGINLWRRVDGRSSKVAQVKFNPQENEAYRVRAAAEGWRLRVWVDDVLQVDAEDATIPMSGRVGIWAGEGVCRFYDFTAAAKPSPALGTEPPLWQVAGSAPHDQRAWSALASTNGVRLTWGGNCTDRGIETAAGAIALTARSDAKAGSHYNGLMIPLPARDLRGQQLVLDLATSTPETTQAVYVRLYDANGKRVASWNTWDRPLANGPINVRLQTGLNSGGFLWEPKEIQGDAASVASIEIIAGTRATNVVFDLRAGNLRTAPPPPSVRDITKVKPLFLDTPLVTAGRPVAAIVAPVAYLDLAKSLQARISQLTGVAVPVIDDASLADAQGRWNAGGLARRGESLIVIGNLESNRLLPLLYARWSTAVDALYPGKGGYALHTIHDPWGNGHNVVIVGGSDAAGVRAATGALLEIMAKEPSAKPAKVGTPNGGVQSSALRRPAANDLSLPRLLDLKLSADLLRQQSALARKPDEKAIAQAVEKARAAFARGQHTGVTLDLYQAGFNYARSGHDGYAELFKQLARLMIEIYRSKPATYGGPWGMDADFNSMQVIAAWDLVEESPVFTEAERLEVTRIIAEYAIDLGNYGNVRGAARPAIRHNHNTFPCLGVLFAADYFGKYYHVAEAAQWLAAADACFQSQALSFKPQEDSNGYQWLTVGHLMRYALARPDHSYFANGNARRTMELAVHTMDNLGYQSAFGDVGGWRGWASEVPLWSIGAWYFGDSLFRWAIAQERPVQSSARAVIGGYETATVPATAPKGFDGLRVFPMERRFYDYWTPKPRDSAEEAWVAPVEQTYDKISFRGGFDPAQPYLLLDGIGCGGHRHYDGNAFIRYSDRGREWFTDGDYIKALPKFHTSLLAFRDGQSSTLPAFCALEAQTDLPGTGLARSTVRNYGGADWSRNVVWLKGRCFVAIDSVKARTAGDYSFRTVWHTLGNPTIEGQRLTLEQQGERFVLDNLDGARLKLTDDASLGKNWNGYTNAAPVVRILQQIVSHPMKAGESHHFLNVFGTSAARGEHPVKAERVSDTSLRVTVGGETMFVGVTDGKRTTIAKGIETDAALFVLRPAGFTLANATVLRANGQTLFQADAPVSVELDATNRRAVLQTSARRNVVVPGSAVRVNGQTVSTQAKDGLVSFSLPPGRQEITWSGAAPQVALSLPSPAPVKATAIVAAPKVPSLEKRWSFAGAFTCLAATDLDGDRKTETVAGDKEGRVRCVGSDGKQRWEFKATKAIESIWAGDLDGDGRGEVIAGSADGSVYVLDGAGRQLWSHAFPYYKRSPVVSVVFAADLDGDGKREVIAGTESWHFYALDRAGRELWHYESVHGSTCGTAADLDGDGKQEVIAGTEYYWWHAVSPAGKSRWGYSTKTGPHANAVAAGDLNGDGKPEIVFGGADGNLHVVSPAGRLLWQFNTGDEVTAVAVRDVTGDGKGKVIATSMSFNLYVLDGAGKTLWRRDRGDVLRDLALVKTDGKLEIAVAGEDGRVALFLPDGTLARETKLDGAATRLVTGDFDGKGQSGLLVLHHDHGITALGHPRQ